MTDTELFNWIQHIANHPALDTSSFKGNAVDTAAFAMGVSSADPYANFNGDRRPWSQTLQIGRMMHAFYDAPAPICIAMGMHIMDRSKAEPVQVRDNIMNGVMHTMSDYAGRIFISAIKEGIESHTTRTYYLLNHILNLANTRAILTSGHMSLELDFVQRSIGLANMALIPICNESVDAHPVAREMLRRYIEEVQRLIIPEVKDAA